MDPHFLFFLLFFLLFFFLSFFAFYFSFLFDPIPSPEERLICSQSYFAFSFVSGPGTDSTNCAGIRSYIIRCSLCARNSRTLGSQLHSDFSFRDCQEKDDRIMVAEQQC